MEVTVPSSVQEYGVNEINTATAPVKLSKNQRRRRNMKLTKRLLEENGGSLDPESKVGVPLQTADIVTQASVQDCLNTGSGSGTCAAQDLDAKSKVPKKRKRQKSKKRGPTLVEILKANGDMGSDSAGAFDMKSIVSKAEEYIEVGNGEICSVTNNTMSKREEHVEIANSGICSGTTAALCTIITPSKSEEHIEIANDGTGTATTLPGNSTESKKKKKKKSKEKKPTLGDILSTSAQKVDTETSNDKLLDTPQIEGLPTQSLVQGCQQMDSAPSGKMGIENMETFTDQNVVVPSLNSSADHLGVQLKKKKKRSKKKRPSLCEILNMSVNKEETETSNVRLQHTPLTEELPIQSLVQGCEQIGINTERIRCETLTTENVEVLKDQNSVVSCLNGSAAINGLESKRKTKTSKKNKPTLGEILNTRVNKEGTDIAKTNLLGTPSVEGSCMQSGNQPKSTTLENVETFKDQNDVVLSLKASAQPYGLQPMRTHVARSRKKLIILDVNGLLGDVVSPPAKDREPDFRISRRSIFKRPFLEDFLGFCFERFDVAIWSSRTQKILRPVVNFLLGDLKHKLLFLWDMSHCINSGFRTLENKHKCIVFKKLKKIWDKNGPHWGRGDYDESNTLLLDDTPYKALLNPKHTGVFPPSYSYKDMNDNFLGPEGGLRAYLEGVAAAEHVRMHVEQHPFGQPAIDETSPHWAFYSRVLKGHT